MTNALNAALLSEEVRTAVQTLLRAWAPAPPIQDEDDWDDETNGCQCAGEDEDGQPLGCNCHDSCGCRQCDHFRHAETRRCHLRVPREGQPYAWCGQPTRFRVTPYCVHRAGVIRAASDGDPAASEHGSVTLGDSIQRHTATYACSTQHARALIEADQEYRAKMSAGSPLSVANTFYEVEAFRYRPDDTDVPGPLPILAADLESALYSTRELIADTFNGRASLDWQTEGLLQSLAWSVRRAAEYAGARGRSGNEDA